MKQNTHISESEGRRDFFKKLVLASIAVNLPLTTTLSCKEEVGFVGSGKAPFKMWEEMLHYLKTSPDHLKNRIESLVEEGNPEKMYEFVKNEIQLIPLTKKGVGDVGKGLKWGLNYTLRCGMATPREKAELLTQMLQESGIPSRVMFESHPITKQEAQSYFFRPIDRVCAPDIPKKALKRWAKELGVSLDYQENEASPEAEMKKAEDLGNRILKTLDLPEDHYYYSFDFRWNGYETPIVEFEIDGVIKYANLFDPKIPYGNLKSENPTKLREAKPFKPNDDKVSIKLTYRDSITPLEEKELIRGEWLARDLVGRQIGAFFLNNLNLEEQTYTKVGNVNVFTPALALQAIDASTDFMTENSVLADPITLSGKRISLNSNQTKIGDVTLLKKANTNLQEQVQQLDVSAKTTGYPSVRLSVSAKANNGDLIEGLSASDFNFLEDGKPIRVTMESNQRTPRILIMYDGSSSMPATFSGEGMKIFIDALRKNILSKYPSAIITDWQTPSSLFTWLLKASQTDNDLVIFATDGDNDDAFNPKDEAIYKSGPPAIVLNVRNSGYDYYAKTFDKMAELTNGLHLLANDHENAMIGIEAYLEKLTIQPYVFTYYSVGDTQTRNVEVSIDNKRVTANTTYAFNTIEGGSQIGPKIIGLYLSIKYANNHEIKRVVAGWDYSVSPREIPSQEMVNDVHDLMLGGMQLYFEGPGPTYSVALSDLLTAKLSTRTWGEALIDDDIALAKNNFEKGQINLSGKALSLMLPLSDSATHESLTIPEGIRIGLQTIKPGVITGDANSLFDYLPTSDYVTLSENAKEAFQTNVIKTAELAIREHQLYPTSTYSELVDASWINIKTANETRWVQSLPKEADLLYWYERVFRNARLRIFDSEATSKAFWNINENGELYGILPNGSGGGGERFKAQLEEISHVINAYMALFGIMGVGGLSVGIMAQYGLTLVKLYAIASEALIVMDTTGMDDKIAKALKGLACNVQKEIMFATMGNAGAIMGGLDNLISQMGGKSPFGC